MAPRVRSRSHGEDDGARADGHVAFFGVHGKDGLVRRDVDNHRVGHDVDAGAYRRSMKRWAYSGPVSCSLKTCRPKRCECTG
jgi:hypothetical protein